MISTAIASVVERFFDSGKGPSHDQLTLFFRQAGLSHADPGQIEGGQQIGKVKRVRRVLVRALNDDADRGGRLVKTLVDAVRVEGGFVDGAPNFVGRDVMESASRAFAEVGYEFDAQGNVRPATLENLSGTEMTEALWTYVRRARSGATDPAHVVGAVKDLSEAVARHVLMEATGNYPGNMNFQGTLYQAYDRLGLKPPSPTLYDQLDPDGRVAMHQALYLLACAANRLRNQEGTGHGRPQPSSAATLDARLAAGASGLMGDLLLSTLEVQHAPPVGAR